MNWVKFVNNTYTYNLGTHGQGLIDIVGIPRINMSLETYEANGDTTYELIKYMESGRIINVSDTSGDYHNSKSELTMYDALTNT